MGRNRCSVCDGRIVDGRCQECGMYYPKERGRYFLNEMPKEDQPKPSAQEVKVNQPAISRMQKPSEKRPEESSRKKVELPQKQAENSRKKVEIPQRQAENYQRKTGNYRGKGSSAIFLIAFVMIFAGVVFKLREEDRGREEMAEPIPVTWEDEGLGVTTYTIEMEPEEQTGESSSVTKEIPISESMMIAGLDFPEGVYDVLIKQGQGYFYYLDESGGSRAEELTYLDQREVEAPCRKLGLTLLEGAQISMEPANEEPCEMVLVPMGWR